MDKHLDFANDPVLIRRWLWMRSLGKKSESWK